MIRRSDRGATLVESALVLPILILLVFGVVEFGRAYNAQVTLTHAAREGVRELAITQNSSSASTKAVDAAVSLDPTDLTVTASSCTAGTDATLSVSYPFTYDIPLLGSQTITLTGTGVMRCGG